MNKEVNRQQQHTYIIGHYNPSVRIFDLASDTTYVVCVNFMHRWRDLQLNSLKSTPNDRSLRNFLRQFYLFSALLSEICWEEIAEGILFRISFWCLAWGSNAGFTSNKPTDYLLDYGDFCNFPLTRKVMSHRMWQIMGSGPTTKSHPDLPRVSIVSL